MRAYETKNWKLETRNWFFMLWRSLNFWRITAIFLFAVVLILAYPRLAPGPKFKLVTSSMSIVSGPPYGALFRYTIKNTGTDGGRVNVNFHAFLNLRGGDTQDDYQAIGVNAGQLKSGEFFMQLNPGQAVHDWRIELT